MSGNAFATCAIVTAVEASSYTAMAAIVVDVLAYASICPYTVLNSGHLANQVAYDDY